MFNTSRKKLLAVQNSIIRIINNNCPELKAFLEGPRRDKRVNLTLVVLVVPLEDGKLQTDKAFYAVTHNLSATGVGIVLDRQLGLDEVILGFRVEGDMTFIRATAKHIKQMGGGFHCLGLEMTEVVPSSQFPQLTKLKF